MTQLIAETEILILGAGLCGMTAASRLGTRALVLEADEKPGGLVQSEQVGGCWFDKVIHLLHFSDPDVEVTVRQLLGDNLVCCPPVAWVECLAGIVRYPLQMNLGGLEKEAVINCLCDVAELSFGTPSAPAENYEEMLLQSFGKAMCETFFFPYNRKMWKQSLRDLSPSGFQWNISIPDFKDVLRGALGDKTYATAYNSNGWYPRPSATAPWRGMEVLARALADRVCDLRLGHKVTEMDLEKRCVTAMHKGRSLEFRFHEKCLSTLPLPQAVKMCRQASTDLKASLCKLKSVQVRSVAVSIKGDRPEDTGHWRYYADESLIFTRLVFMTEFDALCAPNNGFGILAEVTESTNGLRSSDTQLIARVHDDMKKLGYIGPGREVVASSVLVADPAYVVFTPENEVIMTDAREFLVKHGVTPLGRYGRWEYSSMAQVMGDGLAFAEKCRREFRDNQSLSAARHG